MSDLNDAVFSAAVDAAEAIIEAKKGGWEYKHTGGECGCSSSLTFTKGDLKVIVYDLNNIGRELYDAEDRANNPDKYDPPPPSIAYMNRTRKLLRNQGPLSIMEESWVKQHIEAWKARNPHREYPEDECKLEQNT